MRIGIGYDAGGVFDPQRWAWPLRPAPWDPLRRRLSSELNRPIQIEPLSVDQISFHLESGRLQFAFVSPAAYRRIMDAGTECDVVAISEANRRQGVIVADAKSRLSTFADLKNKRFSFGPRNDPVLHQAAVKALESNGVHLGDLARELLPIPGLFQHHISSRESAKEIVYGLGTDAGVIESSEYDAYPETGGQWTLSGFSFSKDQFVVLGRTKTITTDTIDEGPFLAAAHVAPEIVRQVRDFLTSTGERHPDVTDAMGLTRFRSE